MPVKHDQRIAGVWVFVKAGGQKDVRAEVHVAAPEFAQALAPDLHVPDEFSVRRRLDRRDDPVHDDVDDAAVAVDRNPLRRAVDVPGGTRPLLPFSLVHRQLDRFAVTQVERVVLVEQCLHYVVAGGNVHQAVVRIAERGCIDRGSVACRQRIDVDAEYLHRVDARSHLEARLRLVIRGQDQDDPAIQRRRGRFRCQGDRKRRRHRWGGRECCDQRDRCMNQSCGTSNRHS